jgi:hypothetical protein
MNRNDYKNRKQFGPLDDLFELLEKMEETLGVKISDDDYKIGRQQLFFTFMHETTHAFIYKKAKWIYELNEDEYDFIDEVVVRNILDTLIVKLNLMGKIVPFFNHHVDHKNELVNYGYNFKSDKYNFVSEIWKSKYETDLNISGFCKEVLDYYKENKEKLLI